MRYKGSLPKIVYYLLVAVLLALLAGLFILERKQSADYADFYREQISGGKEADSSEEVDQDAEDSFEEDTADTKENTEENSKKADPEARKAEAERICSALSGAVTKSLPGIVFWGDADVVSGQEGSMPETFAAKMNEDLFGSVKGSLEEFSVTPGEDELTVPVADMGVHDEGLGNIMIRSGVAQLLVGSDFRIPAGKEKTEMSLVNESGRGVRFNKEELDLLGRITIEGVEGHFYEGSSSDDDNSTVPAFGRDAEGSGVDVAEGTVIKTEGAEKYKGYVPVLFLHEREDVEDSVFSEDVEKIVSAYDKDHYVLIAATEEGSSLDETLTEAFKDRYIRVDQSAEDRSGEDYTKLADEVYEKLKDQGTFKEIVTAAEDAGKDLASLKDE